MCVTEHGDVVQAMQNIMQNPEFAKMAEDLGKKMFENDPQLASMVQVCLPSPPLSHASLNSCIKELVQPYDHNPDADVYIECVYCKGLLYCTTLSL